MKRRMVLGALLVVAIGVAVVTTYLVMGRDDARSPRGPMESDNAYGWATTDAVGDAFTDGLLWLRLGGDKDAVIEDVRLVGDESLELVGAKLAPPGRAIGGVQYFETFPPPGKALRHELGVELIDAIGATISPMTGDGSEGTWELLLGIQAGAEGYLVRTGVEVDYRIGTEEYTVTIPAHLAVCTSPDLERNGECPPPPNSTD